MCREELSIHGPHHPEPVFTLSSDGQRVETSARYSLRNQSAQQMESTKAPKDATMLSKLYDNEANRFAVAFRTYLASWGYLVLSPNRMRYGWRDSSPKDTGITPRGEHLAVARFHLKNY
ncbi:hypothetical protein IIB79_08605, partial [candidate division KSB1 bacterium]|nr:hypothetical protein [candidate division KSB1 bacterium]